MSLWPKVSTVPASDRILPTDHRITCECGSDGPFLSHTKLRSYAMRAGAIVTEATDELIECLRCGARISIGQQDRKSVV